MGDAKNIGIPFIAHKLRKEGSGKIDSGGVRVSLGIEYNHGVHYQGVLAAGLFAGNIEKKGGGKQNNNLEGLCVGGGVAGCEGTLTGISCAGIFSGTSKTVGLSVGGGFSFCDQIRGINLGGFLAYCTYDAVGANMAGFAGIISDREVKGINLAGAYVDCYGARGANVAGLVAHSRGGGTKGVNAGGVASHVEGELSGVSVGGLYNHAKRNGKFALQVGTINNITEYNPEGTTIQLGLWNRSGNQQIPLINIRGLKNLFKRRKKTAEAGK